MKKLVFATLLTFITVYSFAQTNNATTKKIVAVINVMQQKYLIDNDNLLKDTLFIHLLDSNLALQKFFYLNKKLSPTKKIIPCDEVNGLQRHCLWIYQKDTRFEKIELTYNASSVVKGSLQLVFEDENYTAENFYYREMIK